MAQLIEPDGTEAIVLTVEAAIEFCRSHSGWTWRQLPDEWPIPF